MGSARHSLRRRRVKSVVHVHYVCKDEFIRALCVCEDEFIQTLCVCTDKFIHTYVPAFEVVETTEKLSLSSLTVPLKL